ncbi:MAG TPA: hypothetical protein VKR53_06300 [Puia sp.]|nr:hypothetical protein [Puia sp.]
MALTISGSIIILKAFAQSPTIEKPLTNNDVVSMVSSGISSSIIKATIEKSKTNFDLSPAAVIELKKSRTPDDIVLSMIIKARVSAAAAPEDTLLRMPAGIYNRSDKGYTLVEDHQLLCYASKGAVGMLKKTFGSLVNQTIKTIMMGTHSPLNISETKPLFIFILDFPAKNPEEFFLVRFSRTPAARQICFQKISHAPGIINVNDTVKVAFTIKKVKEGVFEVEPTHPLQPGEYGFIYNETDRYKANSFKAFDFAIVHPYNSNP